MPLYNLACRRQLPAESRAEIARAITQTHCRVTGAPARFVNVVFLDNYPLRGRLQIDVLAGVRSGGNRSPELLERLQESIHIAIAEAAGLGQEQVAVTLTGFPAKWIMEGGEILPEPGTEKARHAEGD